MLGLTFCVANAQKYNIKTYSVNDGLPSSQVFDVHLDDKGLVWFATAYGLAKFDGFKFETFGLDEGLRDELIYDIFEDSQNKFWVSTESGGVGFLRGDTVVYDPEFAPLDSMLINYIIESPDGEMWFGTDAHGVHIWKDSAFISLDSKNGLPSNQIWDIQFLRGNEAWIATMNGLVVYEEEEGIKNTWTEDNGLSGFAAYQVFEAEDKTIWIPTNSGITLISPDNQLSTIKEINGEPLAYVYNINQDDDDLIWIGTERDGLYWFDGEEYTHITKKNGLSSNYIYRLLKAEDGTIWVATEGNGVSIFKDKQFKFFGESTEVNSSGIYSLFVAEEGTIWFGKDGGLGSYKDGVFESFPIPEHMDVEDEIWDIEQLPNGNLLLLTYDYWLLEFDGDNYIMSPLNEPLYNYYINDIDVEEDGDLWIGTERLLLNYSDGALKEFKPSSEYWKSHVNLVFKDSKGIIWLGTEGGLAKFNGTDFIYYTEENGLKGPSIYEVKEDDRGNIWVGTNKGLSVIKSRGESEVSQEIELFEVDEIFLPETISLLFDNQGGLWQGTNAGINYYDIENWYETGEMDKVHFSLQDYGKGLEFNGAAAVIGPDDNLWFGTAKEGLLKYEPIVKPTTMRNMAPQTFIRRVVVNGQTAYEQNISTTEISEINLKHDQNNVEIEYGAVSYKDPYRIFYRYRLNGFDENWNTGYDKREAIYTNLNPGTYTFSVLSKSTSSDWSETASSITINITKPFWLTWWFILLGMTSIGTAIFFLLQAYVNVLEKRKLEDLVEIKTADLQSALDEKEVLIKEIHHRVKNNMAVVSGLLELQSWQMKDKKAKAAIENSRLRIKTMSSVHEKLYQSPNFADVDVQEFVEDLINNISSSLKAFDKNVTVESFILVEKMNVNKAIPSGLILNELISNCFEHAFPEEKEGVIEVTFKDNEDHYHLSVKDNGIGMPEGILGKKRSSLGLTLVQSLTEQIYGTVIISEGEGTYIVITFPK
jgi:two-component sensor histidine kinase/ligand-binding sensor domain-containing protein